MATREPSGVVQYLTICSVSIRASLRSNSSFNTWSKLTFFGNIDSNTDIKACSRFSRDLLLQVRLVLLGLAKLGFQLGRCPLALLKAFDLSTLFRTNN
ncbi:hypothetical protein C2W62_33540 [Candidatus Entotheonella serta]|nr:hypothetical protein C2W62_33540 [Candidatus Entotheonella serta]